MPAGILPPPNPDTQDEPGRQRIHSDVDDERRREPHELSDPGPLRDDTISGIMGAWRGPLKR